MEHDTIINKLKEKSSILRKELEGSEPPLLLSVETNDLQITYFKDRTLGTISIQLKGGYIVIAKYVEAGKSTVLDIITL